MSLLSRSWNLIRQPQKIRTRLVERRMRLAAHEFYRQRTPAENDAERLKQIDAFNHDSLHTTAHMTWEYETAWQYVKPSGFLSSHDVLTTPSWEQFRKRHAAETGLSGRVYGLGFAHKRV